MKRYIFALLLVAGAGACNRSSKPSESALDNRENRDESHLYGSQSTPAESIAGSDASDDMTAPQHRTSDEIASTGEGLPDSTRSRSAASTGGNATAGGAAPMDTTPPGGVTGPDTTRTPDNTGVNERDRSGTTLTPMDQGESESDIKLTQEIRRALMDSEALSFSSKNVKVITRNGKVTLRGTVPNARERSIVEDAATTRAGASGVDNQLEIANK